MTEQNLVQKELPLEFEKSPHLLSELIFAKGRPKGEERVAVVPKLVELGVKHGISTARAGNMLEEKEDLSGSITRQEKFLEESGMASMEHGFLILPQKPGETQIIEITAKMVAESAARPPVMEEVVGKPIPDDRGERRRDVEFDVRANCLFTQEKGVPLMVKPADCPVLIIYAKDRDGKPVLGLLHAGRAEVDSGLAKDAINHLVEKYGSNLEEIVIGITPGIGVDSYVVDKGAYTATKTGKPIIDIFGWRGRSGISTSNEEPQVHLDLTGKLLDQLETIGVKGENIEAYGPEVDTFELAAEKLPLMFSHRLSTVKGIKSSRFLVAAQL